MSHEPWTPTHSHVDGGLYRILIDDVEGRASNHEPWVPGLVYEGADGVAWWTGKDRWEDRFRPIEGVKT